MKRTFFGSTVLVIALLGSMLGCGGQTPSPEAGVVADLPAFELDEKPAFPLTAHLESVDIVGGQYSFAQLFESGAELFHTPFNGLDGVGIARRPNGQTVNRFAPRGPQGPAAQSCGACHGFPERAAAGLAHTAIAGDPDSDGAPPFNVRTVPSMFGNGLLQLLAQEMTEELQAIRDEAETAAKGEPGTAVSRELVSKGSDYGTLTATADADGEVAFDLSAVEGIDPDLVVKPLAWKGDVATVRIITAGPAFGGLGMLPEELEWELPGSSDNPDPDGDGVTRELSVGDITAMTIYGAAQETPTGLARLAELGYVQAPTAAQLEQIAAGRAAFESIGCARCHSPQMHLLDTVFEEPTLRGNGHYYNKKLAERDSDYDPARPFTFDLLSEAQPPRAEPHPEGGAIVRLYGDLKRHRMGQVLADPAPAVAGEGDENPPVPADEFLTAELWGVGNTGPWLHDGRAGTLDEAVRLHGEDEPPATLAEGRSEAQEARDAYVALPGDEQRAVVAFLRSLLTFSPEES